jgi:hypothetical protein
MLICLRQMLLRMLNKVIILYAVFTDQIEKGSIIQRGLNPLLGIVTKSRSHFYRLPTFLSYIRGPNNVHHWIHCYCRMTERGQQSFRQKFGKISG